MASDSYMQIDGVKGDATDAGHKDWIEIQSFNHVITQPASATAASSGGGTYARAEHGDYEVVKQIDLSSPTLNQMCASGKHIKSVIINLMRASGDASVLYLKVELKECIISKVLTNGNSGAAPTETVAFNYGTILWTYTAQKRADGSKGGNVAAGYDVTQNKIAA
jgi:type VI secretion system secreted protein Hcp